METFTNWQGRYSWKILFWGWGRQSIHKKHSSKPEKNNVGPDQKRSGAQAVPVCQKLNNGKADPQNTEGRRPAIPTQTSSERAEGQNRQAQDIQSFVQIVEN